MPAMAKPASPRRQARVGDEATEGEALRRRRWPLPPALFRDDQGGDHGTEGEDRLERARHRQVHGGEARRVAAGQLQEDALHPAARVRRQGQARQGQGLLQALRSCQEGLAQGKARRRPKAAAPKPPKDAAKPKKAAAAAKIMKVPAAGTNRKAPEKKKVVAKPKKSPAAKAKAKPKTVRSPAAKKARKAPAA